MPVESKYRIFSRLRSRLQNAKRSPDSGSEFSFERTRPLRPLNDLRMSVGPGRRNTRLFTRATTAA